MERSTRMRRPFRATAAAAAASAVAIVGPGAAHVEAFCTIAGIATVHERQNSRLFRLSTSIHDNNRHHGRRRRASTSQCSMQGSGDTDESASHGGGGVGGVDTKPTAPVARVNLVRSERLTSKGASANNPRLLTARGDARIRPRALAPLRAAADQGPEHSTFGGGYGGEGSPTVGAAPSLRDVGVEDVGKVVEGGGAGGRGGVGRGRRMPLGHITDETLDLIRASTSITEVIGQHVEMKPAGRGMIGCCPFHAERTPSFSVDESRGSYHCFGCGASGDVIKFTMEIEGLGFREVVRDLAEHAGISLGIDTSSPGGGSGTRADSGDEKARREARERLSLVLQMAAQFYTRCLVEMPAAGAARAHILERGISPVTVMDFQLGYSPADLTSPLIEYLDQEGFKMDTLVDAGLVPDTSKWKYPTPPDNPRSRVDRFRGRLVVPIRDHKGSVIGFGARDLSDSQGQGSVGSGFVIQDPAKKSKRKRKSSSKEAYTEEGEAKAREQAVGVAGAAAPATAAATEGATGVGEAQKARPVATYLNSPETSIFKKGKNLFGLDLAKEAIRTQDMAVVVEGYFDVIKLHDAGVRNTVGVLGTAITIDQLQLCARYSKSKRIVLCMDGDDAGQRAVERLCESPASSGLDSLSEAGVSVSVASIPKDSGCKDPADFLQMHGAEAFRAQVIEEARPWSDWHGDRILAAHADFAADANVFRRLTDRLTGFISDLSIPTDQTFHVHRFANVLAGGNEVMRHQLEFDLVSMSNEKRARKNALRKRVGSSPVTLPRPDAAAPAAMLSQQQQQLEDLPTTSPGTTTDPSSRPIPFSAEIRRLSGGRIASQVVDCTSLTPEVEGSSTKTKRSAPGGAPTKGTKKKGDGLNVGGGEMLNTTETAEVLRNHEWVMERVKLRKREESRMKREKYASKDSIVWSPSVEEEDARLLKDDEDATADDLVLRGRILDQAQRYLLTLAVHDPSRRAKCAEEVARHGLDLGSERRRWLFDTITRGSSRSSSGASGNIGPLDTDDTIRENVYIGNGTKVIAGDCSSSLMRGAGQSTGSQIGRDNAVLNEDVALVSRAERGKLSLDKSSAGTMWWTPSLEALNARGETLLDELRGAAPPGYFGRRVRAGPAARATSAGEQTLDWVFDRREAERVKGENVDLVLLEVVMVMLKEQAAAKMHALSDELSSTSNAIARAMAEAAAAPLFANHSSSLSPASQSSPSETVANSSGGREESLKEADVVSGGHRGGDCTENDIAGPTIDGVGGVVGSGSGVGRSREDAQAEVDRLRARQSELFVLIRIQQQEVADLDAQRKAFTSRLPKVRAETRASRQYQKQVEMTLARRRASLQQQPRQLPCNAAPARTTTAEVMEGVARPAQVETEEEIGQAEEDKTSLRDLPMIFLPEDREPEEGINIYDVEGNLASAREVGVISRSPPPSRPAASTARSNTNVGQSSQEFSAAACGEDDHHGRSTSSRCEGGGNDEVDNLAAAVVAMPASPAPPAPLQQPPLPRPARPPHAQLPPPASSRSSNQPQAEKRQQSSSTLGHEEQQQHQQIQSTAMVSSPPVRPAARQSAPPPCAEPPAYGWVEVDPPPPPSLHVVGWDREAKEDKGSLSVVGPVLVGDRENRSRTGGACESIAARMAREAEEEAEMLEASMGYDEDFGGSRGWWSAS